jgi:hypothetical protein
VLTLYYKQLNLLGHNFDSFPDIDSAVEVHSELVVAADNSHILVDMEGAVLEEIGPVPVVEDIVAVELLE